jgi:asparagine synthase (glutamine-hydrolysing)
MCGIAGFVSKNLFLDQATLVSMRDTLIHRGPDDAGCLVWGPDGILASDAPGIAGLAHRRLSIIDLSAAGHQPMSNESETLWIIYNGEFYNFESFHRELSTRHSFNSRTDTETIIHLFEDFGIEETLRRINGMFAFAMLDIPSNTLILARDRLGKKPLFYSQLADGSLIFASEIKSLLRSGLIDRDAIDPIALIQFWTYGYATGERTIYRQIKRLLPGHYATWHDGQLTLREYWDCIFGVQEFAGRSLEDMGEELEELLIDAIRLRMVSDVPVGLFLSGGIDSSLVAALTAKHIGRDIHSYTIGFTQEAYDESLQAKTVADHLGLANKVLKLQGDAEPLFAQIARQFDEPFGDKSAIPTYFVSKLAKQYATVVLTGDGGDELFAGYNLYSKALSLWGNHKQRKMFSQANSIHQKVSDLWFRYGLKDKKLSVLEMLLSPRDLHKVLSRELWEDVRGKAWYGEREQWYGRVAGADVVSQFQYINLKTYLPDCVLVKVDRMSMAHAQECRSPLLDHRVVAFAARLPLSAKIDGAGRQKHILRHLLKKYLPDHLVDRPKRGFSPPWGHWCRGPLGERLKGTWLKQTNGYQNPRGVEQIFPKKDQGIDALQWNALSSLVFFNELL